MSATEVDDELKRSALSIVRARRFGVVLLGVIFGIPLLVIVVALIFAR
jgi:hypothetical protein